MAIISFLAYAALLFGSFNLAQRPIKYSFVTWVLIWQMRTFHVIFSIWNGPFNMISYTNYMIFVILWWWHFQYVDDFSEMLMADGNVGNRSPTFQTCHSQKLSLASVTNIDVGVSYSFTNLKPISSHLSWQFNRASKLGASNAVVSVSSLLTKLFMVPSLLYLSFYPKMNGPHLMDRLISNLLAENLGNHAWWQLSKHSFSVLEITGEFKGSELRFISVNSL